MKKQVKEEKMTGKKRSSAYLKMFTVVVFGEARTGKSSLIKTFLGETFNDDYEPTVEEFYSKQILYNDRNYQVDHRHLWLREFPCHEEGRHTEGGRNFAGVLTRQPSFI